MLRLKKLTFMVFALCIANIIFSQEVPKSYYVSAQGNDDTNNGRTEATAFKTLRKAVEVASKGIIKRITIIGTLNQASENNSTMSSYAVFLIDYNGKDELLITGKENASSKEKAILSANGTKVRVVNLNLSTENKSKIRFEHIEISGANTNHDGAGIYAFSGYTTLGKGTVIKNNTTSGDGGGIYVRGHCSIEDGVVITQNSAAYGGGIYDKSSQLTIDGGLITKNNAQFFGGGISSGNSSSSLFTINDCTISENMAGKNGGGLYTCGESIINNVVIVNNSAKAVTDNALYATEILRYGMIIIGAVSSAALVVAFNFSIKSLERCKLKTIGFVLLDAIVLTMGSFWELHTVKEEKIVIAGKFGVEPDIIINMYKALIEQSRHVKRLLEHFVQLCLTGANQQ